MAASSGIHCRMQIPPSKLRDGENFTAPGTL